ncbi:hypothetical protein [Microbacterium oleivorans]|uniref:Uncharacterized protein n=1 Tax=Microbacterium oleivorans TaxID=273677 RepID=A0A4R5YKB7_9MICO|nr:hypothetical protein [Microbacterium oleivorans]TDL43857.1 hypothetical protein E2R54_11750 [Microbacterium oleivorans]
MTPEGYSREELLSLPPAVRLTEISLRLYADDHGRERVNSRLMLASFYPLDRDMTDATIVEHLLMLDDAGCLTLYDLDGATYYAMEEWPTVDRAKPSRFPEPPLANASRTSREGFVAGEREREGEEREGERGPARPPREGSPPSPFCPTHRATGGTEEPCRSCGRHRMQRKVWDDERFAASSRGEVTSDDDEPF